MAIFFIRPAKTAEIKAEPTVAVSAQPIRS
jgi:hypothetical protein